MGEVRAEMRLENDVDRALAQEGSLEEAMVRSCGTSAVVDTGAVMVLLPQDRVEALGLKVFGKIVVSLANDQRVELDRAGTLSLTVAGREMKTDCLVGPPGCEPLLGQLVLERLDLIIDPVKKTLTPRPESPFLPTLKLKTSLLEKSVHTTDISR